MQSKTIDGQLQELLLNFILPYLVYSVVKSHSHNYNFISIAPPNFIEFHNWTEKAVSLENDSGTLFLEIQSI